tara:strand:+ start:36 stop:1220 length:1185 start_codon:yes stop_codon:yes gene_type:complete
MIEEKNKKLNDLVGVERYIKVMDKWHDKIEEDKFLFLLISGSTGVGKSTLGELYLKNKGYNVIYFDIATVKNKNKIYGLIRESFKTYDICSMLSNKKKKIGYIIDNIDNSSISKNDIVELHNLFVKNKTKRPVIFVGKFSKVANYPKKKIEHMKMNIISDSILYKIGKKEDNNIDDIKLKLIISKCQNDIKKLLVLLDYFRKYNNIDSNNITLKDTDYNLFYDFNNLISQYKNIKKTEVYCDHAMLLNYTFHQNVYNLLKDNCKYNVKDVLYDYNYRIFENITLEYCITKNNNWELVEYIYFNGPKYISYDLNKIKKNKNVNTEVEYPKYCYILNQKNLFKKMIMLFKDFDFYDNLNINNFKVFLEGLFTNEEENKDILLKLKSCDINQLKKLL